MSLAELIVAKALSHVGDHEEPMGSNSGPEVDKFLAYVGVGPGEPWCAAFACFVVGNAILESGNQYEFPRTASSGAIELWGVSNYATVLESSDTTGTVGLLRGDSPTGYVHTVIAIGPVHTDGWVETVEGNFGDRVQRNRRLAATLDFVFPIQVK